MGDAQAAAVDCTRPVLAGRVEVEDRGVRILRDGIDKLIAAEGMGAPELAAVLAGMDGSRTADQLARDFASVLDRRELDELIAALDVGGLLDDCAAPVVRSGLEAILEIEDFTAELCSQSLYRNVFWERCLAAREARDFPKSVAIGLVIENYHFLFRESYFDAPVLSYVPNTQVRLELNRFYAEEYGHDEILLKALNAVGLSRADMADSIPLPQTMALCNALAYWSHNDPLFFFTTLGLLEGQGLRSDSFIDALERIGTDPAFVAPLRHHSNINIGAGHGNLTRTIFAAIPAIAPETVERLKAQTVLFVELYDAFYRAVWEHYSRARSLLRRVSEL